MAGVQISLDGGKKKHVGGGGVFSLGEMYSDVRGPSCVRGRMMDDRPIRIDQLIVDVRSDEEKKKLRTRISLREKKHKTGRPFSRFFDDE